MAGAVQRFSSLDGRVVKVSAALHLLEGARTGAEYLLFLLLLFVFGENLEDNFCFCGGVEEEEQKEGR